MQNDDLRRVTPEQSYKNKTPGPSHVSDQPSENAKRQGGTAALSQHRRQPERSRTEAGRQQRASGSRKPKSESGRSGRTQKRSSKGGQISERRKRLDELNAEYPRIRTTRPTDRKARGAVITKPEQRTPGDGHEETEELFKAPERRYKRVSTGYDPQGKKNHSGPGKRNQKNARVKGKPENKNGYAVHTENIYRQSEELDSSHARSAWTKEKEKELMRREALRMKKREQQKKARKKKVRITQTFAACIALIVLLAVGITVNGRVSGEGVFGNTGNAAEGHVSGSTVTVEQEDVTDESDASEEDVSDGSEAPAVSFSSNLPEVSSASDKEDTDNDGGKSDREPMFDAKLDVPVTTGSRTAEDGVQVGIAWTGNMVSSDKIPSIELLFYQAIVQAGAEPVFLDKASDEASAAAVLDGIDCLVVCGGSDIDPAIYGETAGEFFEGPAFTERDISDFWVLDVAIRSDIPTLSVCRGMQMLNVVCGGSLVQDIPSEIGTSVLHRESDGDDFVSHNITIRQEGLLWSLEMMGNKSVNSFHHQCVKELGKGLTVDATADDGVVEAIEMDGKRFMLGLQYHPERALADGETSYLTYFQALINAAA